MFKSALTASAPTNWIDFDTTTGSFVSKLVPTNSSHSVKVNMFINTVTASTTKYYASGAVLYSGALFSAAATTTTSTSFNYSSFLDVVNVYINNLSYTVSVVSHRLTLTDVSVPISTNNIVDVRTTTSTSTGLNPNDVCVIQPSNYGLRLDGRGNPVEEVGLQLNGNDRFDPRLGSYFNYVQPYECHTRTPVDGVCVYSFGLHPEQHQPSGTCNLSRIDNTVLILRLSDPLRKKTALVLDVADSKLWTFAFSYNVLRIMSGMGGLAYSN